MNRVQEVRSILTHLSATKAADRETIARFLATGDDAGCLDVCQRQLDLGYATSWWRTAEAYFLARHRPTRRPVRNARQLRHVAFWTRPHIRTAPELRFLAGAQRVDAWMVAAEQRADARD